MIEATVELTVFVKLRVDETVIDRMLSEDWQRDFYTIADRDEALFFLANMLGINGGMLSNSDGFADLDDSLATGHISDINGDQVWMEPATA